MMKLLVATSVCQFLDFLNSLGEERDWSNRESSLLNAILGMVESPEKLRDAINAEKLTNFAQQQADQLECRRLHKGKATRLTRSRLAVWKFLATGSGAFQEASHEEEFRAEIATLLLEEWRKLNAPIQVIGQKLQELRLDLKSNLANLRQHCKPYQSDWLTKLDRELDERDTLIKYWHEVSPTTEPDDGQQPGSLRSPKLDEGTIKEYWPRFDEIDRIRLKQFFQKLSRFGMFYRIIELHSRICFQLNSRNDNDIRNAFLYEQDTINLLPKLEELHNTSLEKFNLIGSTPPYRVRLREMFYDWPSDTFDLLKTAENNRAYYEAFLTNAASDRQILGPGAKLDDEARRRLYLKVNSKTATPPEEKPPEDTDDTTNNRNSPREKGSVRKKLLAALVTHHGFDPEAETCKTYTPVTPAKLLETTKEKNRSSCTQMFDAIFNGRESGGYDIYINCCKKNRDKLNDFLMAAYEVKKSPKQLKNADEIQDRKSKSR
jgi:hypothetical protein